VRYIGGLAQLAEQLLREALRIVQQIDCRILSIALQQPLFLLTCELEQSVSPLSTSRRLV
jgi:hypothetical protein